MMKKNLMMRKMQVALLLASYVTVGFAQGETLKKIVATTPLEVRAPLMVDPAKDAKDPFGADKLLKLGLTIPEQTGFTQKYDADADGFFRVGKVAQGASVQLFAFYVRGDRYGNVKVTVTTPDLAELFVNGKSVATKTTSEDGRKEAKELSTTLTPYPETDRVVVKLLRPAGAKAEPVIKVALEPDSTEKGMKLSTWESGKRPIELNDAIKGKRVYDTKVSPKGNYVLMTYTYNHGETSTYPKELYSIKTGRRVTIAPNNDKHALGWMPRSERLFYLSKDDGNVANLITIDPETLEEKVMARNVPYEWVIFSPDEKALFYSKGDEPKKTEDVYRMQTVTDRSGGTVPLTFIYRYDLGTGLTTQLTFGDRTATLNDIAHDGQSILFTITDETITEQPFTVNSHYRLDLRTMRVDTLCAREAHTTEALFSPDGRKVLFLGDPEAFGRIGLNVGQGQTPNSFDVQAYLMDVATKKVEPLTRDFNPSISKAKWSGDGRTIYFEVADEDHVYVYAYDVAAKKFNRLPSEEDVVNAFDVANQAPVMAYSGEGLMNSTRAYVYDLNTKKTTRIADPYAEHLAQLKLQPVKDWNFTNSDGQEIKGFYYLPPDFDPNKKYPMIVFYYGGTLPNARYFGGRYPMHVYASLGYVVYELQPSGAIGFGQKFSALHVNAWGKRSSDDIIEGTRKFIADHPFVDGKKVGCIGASYGGFMTMHLQTRTDLFAAAVAHAGISSIAGYWGEGHWGYSYSTAASAGSYPWNNKALYVDQSPLFNADKINTPILLINGTSDTNVPPGQSVQMYVALKILGKPVELVQVKGEDHFIMDYNKRVKWTYSILSFFDRWLKGQPAWWNSMYDPKP